MLYFVRHGQTDLNKQEKIQGGIDVPLNRTGRRQAHAAKRRLAGVQFDKVFSSPQLRAVQTCEIICGGGLEKDERISERKFGKFEGLAANKTDFAGMWDREREKEFPEVEKIEDFKNRIYSFLDEVTKKFPGKNVLVVSHGGTGYFIKTYFDGFPKEGETHKLYGNGETDSFEM